MTFNDDPGYHGHGVPRRAPLIGYLTPLGMDEPAWHAAISICFRYKDQAFSFTDCTCYVLAQGHQADEEFGFNAHFLMFGVALRPIMS